MSRTARIDTLTPARRVALIVIPVLLVAASIFTGTLLGGAINSTPASAATATVTATTVQAPFVAPVVASEGGNAR